LRVLQGCNGQPPILCQAIIQASGGVQAPFEKCKVVIYIPYQSTFSNSAITDVCKWINLNLDLHLDIVMDCHINSNSINIAIAINIAIDIAITIVIAIAIAIAIAINIDINIIVRSLRVNTD